ncbi:hypothetical protein BRADI_3g51890v3 [Brachypodium distachyon]|uniref:Ionotropic glutamate receptor C-terminal domain-containing protein n=1 Tax=Brachypodium distachyon TaxID=15368 RepID=A0A2K2D4N4_BRADI|nr:hypothetical protein BRADI_3g51890v3 [Brachypodium distachyon]
MIMGKHPGTSSSSLFVPLFCFLVSSVVGQQQGSLHVVAAAQEGAPVPVPVRVGVILNWASPVSRRRRTGIEMAVEDYYAAHPGSPAKVELHFRDSSGDVVGAASAAVDLIKNAQVQAIIGPQTSSEAEFVAHLGSRAHVPVLSYSATSPSLSPSQTPFFIRTAANDSLQALPLAAFLAAFGWRAVAVVHEDSPYGAGILPALADALVSASGGSGSAAAITHRAALPVDAGNDRLDAVLRALASAPTRVVIVHARYALAARLFARAWEAGMVSEGYVWVATDGVGSFVDSLSQEDLEAMQGVVSVRPQVKRTREVRNFAARFRARFRHDNPDLDDEHVVHDESTVMRLWSYDTAWAIAAAADEAVGSSAFQPTPPQPDLDWVGVSATGARLLKALVDTRFDGMAGKFKLVDGQLQVAAYEVVNVVGRGTRTVGLWMPPESSSGSKLLKLKHILWPGDTLSTPKGWTPASHNGMPVLRVAVPVKRGFKQFVGVDPKNSSRITGYCIDVFDEVMRSLAYPVAYRYVPFPDSSDSYDKLVDLVRREEADVVVGDVTITASRMDNGVDYTMPFTESGWAMVVAVREDAGSACMWVFLQPLTTSLWLASFAFFCFTGFVVWVLEHRVNDKFRGTPTQQFGLIFYFAFSTLVFSHREAGEQPVQVGGDRMGVRGANPDIELHGEPDINADGPKTPADGDGREGAAEAGALHRVPGGHLHRALAQEDGLRRAEDEEVQHGGAVRRGAVQGVGERRGGRRVRRDPLPEALPVAVLRRVHDGGARVQDGRVRVRVPEGLAHGGGRVEGDTEAGRGGQDGADREGVVWGAGRRCLPGQQQQCRRCRLL